MQDRSVRIQPERAALLVVDIQPDFMPDGPLAVAGGDEVLSPIADLMERGGFQRVLATQDWHPAGHVSFASSHAGKTAFDVIDLYGHDQVLWPDHCVQGTPGAELHRGLDWRRIAAVVRKGMEPDTDSYSGFRNNWNPRGVRPATGLAGFLRDCGVDTLYLCGLARDYCVTWSAEDAAAAGFETTVIWDLTRAVDPGADGEIRQALASAGVRIVNSGDLMC